MPARDALTDSQIDAALPTGWQRAPASGGQASGENRISRELRFKDFKTAMGFMVRVGFEAEAMDHHPEFFNVYDRVILTLTTHDAGNRVTETDLELARRIDALVS